MIREDWVEARLEEVCGIYDNMRKPVNSSERNKRIQGKKKSDLYPYYGATGLAGYIDDYLFDGEFVLVGEDAAPFFDYRKNVAYIIRGKSWVNNHAHVLKSFFNNKFLCLYLNQFNYNGYVSGTTRLKLNQRSLKKIPIKIAPLPEQRAIVAKIEELFSELDSGIDSLRKAKEQLEIYRQAVLKAAFEGKLTKEWREDNSIESSDWIRTRLDEVSVAIGGYAFKSKNFKETGKYQVIRIGNIRPGQIRYNASPVFIDDIEENVLTTYKLNLKDVLITLTGTRNKRDYGYTALVDSTNLLLNQRVAALRFNNKCIPEYFLYYSWTNEFKNQFFASETGNVGQGNVGMKSIRNTNIPLPFVSEQEQIIKEIESRLSVCEDIESNIKEAIEKAEALRQSILKKAFEGKLLSKEELEACKQQEDWEPPEVLLKRVKEDKKEAK